MDVCFRFKTSWLALCLLAMPVLANAHDDELAVSDALSLHSVLEKTIARYPDSKMWYAKQLEADARNKHARGFLPFAPAVGLINQNDVVTSGRGELEWAAELELPIWLPGQRAAREAIARDAQAGLIDSQASLALQVAGLLRDAMWDISMTTNQASIAVSRYETALALLNDVEKRFKAGDLAKTDVMLAQNDVAQAETIKIRAEAEVQHAQFRYGLLTGIKSIPASYTENKSNRVLDDQHPVLRDMAKRLLIAGDERDLVQVEKRENPSVLINARSQRGPFDNQSNESLGFKVRIPLDSEVRSAPLVASAEMNVAKNQSEQARLQFALEAAFHEAEHNLEVTQAELVVVTKQFSIVQESLRLARKAFSLGESDLVNLLRVQATTYETERTLKQKQIQLQWDIAHYNQAVGELP